MQSPAFRERGDHGADGIDGAVAFESRPGDALFFHHCLFVRAMCSGLSTPRFASMMAKRQYFVWREVQKTANAW